MSKKSRKKSSKTSRTGAPRAAAKAKPVKARSAAARKPSRKTTSQASHKAPSKRLRSPTASRAGKPAASASSTAQPTIPGEGAPAPAFHLPRDGGSSVSLEDFRGKKLVLFFYPRADTPGCTREAIAFTQLSGAFAETGTAVLGISADPLRAQEAFRDKHKLSVPLVSDEKHQMLEAYGAWGEKSMYGRTFLGIVRTTVLVGRDGRIARVWRHVKVDGHAEAVLEAARAL